MFAVIFHPFARLRPRRRALLALACAALLAAGAGGSGSSGFDIAAENLAIEEALDAQTCVASEGLVICPSGGETPGEPPLTRTATPLPTTTPTAEQPAPTAGPTVPIPATLTATVRAITATPSATPIPAPRVETNLGMSDIAECALALDSADCVFLFSFQPIGFPASARYEVAYRAREPDSDWIVVPAPEHVATLALDPGVQYQLSVLVYENGPPAAPGTVNALAVTGATYAFVTPVLTVEQVNAR